MKKLLLLVLWIAAALPAVADHLPAKLLAHGKPETTLAGINLETTTLEQVFHKYGPPTKTITVPNNPSWTGYLWQKDGIRLDVEATRSAGKTYLNRVAIIQISVPTSGAASKESTGAGLKLGDGLDTLKRLYGTRFLSTRQEKIFPDTEPFLFTPGSQLAIVQWAQMEFTLTAGLDDQGKIIALRLSPPECYPGGCK